MLLDKIQKDLILALKAGKKEEVSTLRFLLAEIHNRQIDQKTNLSDQDVLAAIKMQVKQHQESIILYRQGKRDELVAKERKELEYLSKYLPQQMNAGDLEKIIQETIDQVKPTGPQDFGKVMGAVMGRVKGQADGNQVSSIVKKLL